MNLSWAGLLLVAAGGAMQGSFALPHKFVRGWAWEKMWAFYSLAAMIVLPWILTAALIPDPFGVYAGAGAGVVAQTAVFGFGWGLGSVLFGLGIANLGMALGIGIILSLVAAVGSLVPLIIQHPDQVFAQKGITLMLGLALVVIGLVFCARAGGLREGSKTADRSKLMRGLIMCVCSGILSPMMSFAFAFGKPIADEAIRRGADPVNADFAKFTIAVTSGFIANIGYCLYLLARNKSWGGEAGRGGVNALFACAGGALWLFGFFFYSQGQAKLGPLGTPIGWPVFMMITVMIANVWSLATGEWRNAAPGALRNLLIGMVVLLAALGVVASAA